MSLFRSAVFIGVLVFLAGIANAQVCVTPSTTASHWWTADGSTKDIVGTNTGTLVNGATYGAGMVNSAFKLNGNNYVDIGQLSGIGLGSFAVEAWVKVDGNNLGNKRVVSWDNVGAPVRSAFALKSSTGGASGKPSFVIVNGGSIDQIVAPTALTPGWHFLAATRDVVAGTMSLIVDGNVVATKTGLNTVAPVLSVDNAAIGAVNAGNQTENFVGCIDEVTIYDGALGALPASSYFTSVFQAGAAGKCHLNADLLTTIIASNQMPDNGAPVTYTVTVTNKGPNTATNVTVTTTLDGNLIPQGTCTGGTSCTVAANVATGTIATLTSGSSVTFTIDATVSKCTVDMTPITTTAMAMSSVPDPVGQNNTATVIIYNCDTTTTNVDAVTLSSVAQSYSFTVSSMCTLFSVTSDSPSWLIVDSIVGSTITFHVTANSGVTRQGYLIIHPTGSPISPNFVYPTVMVTQSAGGGAYSVAGRVWNKYQTAGIPGVQLTISTYSGSCPVMAPYTVTTDLFGNWNATGFQPGCNYMVAPPAGYRLARQVFNRSSTTINFYSTAP